MTTSLPSPRTWSSAAIGGSPALLRESLTLQGVEDQVRARDLQRGGSGVRPQHLPARPDHHQRPVVVAALLDVRAVLTRDLALGMEVGQQRDRDPQVLLEGLVAEGRVDGDPVELRALLLQLAEHLLVHVHLIRADRAPVARVEDQHDRLAAELGQRDGLAVLVEQREVGSLGARLDHRRRPSSWISARYRSRSFFWRYLSRRRRWPTSISRPRREWWSFLCSRRCSVRWLMRAVSRATWTSVDPVSLSPLPWRATISCFCSTVSVISGGQR